MRPFDFHDPLPRVVPGEVVESHLAVSAEPARPVSPPLRTEPATEYDLEAELAAEEELFGSDELVPDDPAPDEPAAPTTDTPDAERGAEPEARPDQPAPEARADEPAPDAEQEPEPDPPTEPDPDTRTEPDTGPDPDTGPAPGPGATPRTAPDEDTAGWATAPLGDPLASSTSATERTGHATERPTGRMPEAASPGPSIAILSLRDIRPIVDYGGLHEAEDALVEMLGAAMYRVVLTSARYGRAPFDRPLVRRALNSSRLARPYRIEHRATSGGSGTVRAEVLLVLAKDLTDAAALVGVPGWHRLGERVIMHIAVVTERGLRRYPELVAQLRRRVDALFSGTEMPPLGHLRSERLSTIGVVPPLLDVLAFPTHADRERAIDVFSPGVRPPGQDRLLRQWANAHGGNYQQNIGQLGAITSHTQHRKIFTTMATRSRLFLTNFSQFDHRRHSGGHREVGARFYDAMASGCALVGDLPVSSRRFVENVAPARPLSLPLTARRLPPEVIDALADHAESNRLGTLARATALRRADVAHRWTEIAELAGLPAAPGVAARIEQLGQMADDLDPTTHR